MSNVPDTLKYTKDHEWVLLEGSTATVGVTEFAQSELGEIVFVDLPAVGKEVSKGGSFCVLESTKAASDVYAPISGKIKEVNSALSNEPTMVNSDPYKNGWLAKFENVSSSDVAELMDAAAYKAHIGQ
jgi:glycine cleavage system H protein